MCKVSHIILKASKVDETWVGKVTRFLVIDTQEEVQSKGRDHGSKELETGKKEEKRDDKKVKGRKVDRIKQKYLLSSSILLPL